MLHKYIKPLVQKNPSIWNFAWKILHNTNFFLPHDITYRALPLLISNKSDIILDIGSNQGISTLGFRMLCPEAKIIGFEPNKALEENLKKIKGRINDFEFHMCGLGDCEGFFELYVPKYKQIYLHTFSSLDLRSLNLAIKNTYKSDVINKIQIESFKCEIKTLDSFNLNPSVIKIDAEGFEKNILNGGIKTITKSRPSIIFEAVHGDLNSAINDLQLNNYSITSYDNKEKGFSIFEKDKFMVLNNYSNNLIAIPSELITNLKIITKN